MQGIKNRKNKREMALGDQHRLFARGRLALSGARDKKEVETYTHPNGVTVVLDTRENREALEGVREIEKAFKGYRVIEKEAGPAEENRARGCLGFIYLIVRKRRGK
jgi:hypothetical protein